jgi:hypothetical protein
MKAVIFTGNPGNNFFPRIVRVTPYLTGRRRLPEESIPLISKYLPSLKKR